MKNLYFTAVFFLIAHLLYAQPVDSCQFYLKKGRDQNQDHLYALAAKSFDKAISFDPQSAQAYIEDGKVNLSMRRLNEAMMNFTKAYQLQPENQEVIRALSTLYYNNRQFEKAVALVQKCTACSDADRILGMSYYNLGDYGKAEHYLSRAVSQDRKDGESAYTLGKTYLELENEKAAIQQYQNAIAAEPGRNVWTYELGLIYYDQNDYKDALKYIQLAGDSGYFKSNDYYENLGFALLYTGDKAGGLRTLNIVEQHKPNNKELINNIAYALFEIKQYDDALNYYAKLLELDPKDASALYMAGIVFQKKGDKAKGEKLCDRAIQMDPSLAKNRQKREISMGL